MKNRVFLLSVALVTVLSIALNQQSNPVVSWFSPASQVEAQAASRTFAREGLDAVLFFFQEKGIKPYVDGVAIDDDALTTQKICELAGYSRVAYLKSRNFASCGDNFIEYWNGSAWIRSAACSRQPYIDTLTCDTPIVASSSSSVTSGNNCQNAQGVLSSIYTNVTGGNDLFSLNQSNTSAYCNGSDMLLSGAGTMPYCDNASSPACNLRTNYEFSGYSVANGRQGWINNYSVQGDKVYDTIRSEVSCVADNSVTSQYFTTYTRNSGAINDYYSLNQSKNTAFCDAGDLAIAGAGTNVFCDKTGDGGCGVQMLEFNGRIVENGREGWKANYSMIGDAIYDTIQTTVVCLKKGPLFDQTMSLYHVVNESNDAYSLNQGRTEVLCNAGDIAIGGAGNPSYCDNGNNPACGRTQYLEANRKFNSGNRQGWVVRYDLGGDSLYDTQRVEVSCLGLNNACKGTSSSSSSSSSTSTGGWQCSNGIDDDGDGQTDSNDPGCHTDRNRFNSMSYNPYGNENDNNRSYTCQDGVDNNTNGLVDSQDPICHWDGNANNNPSFTPNANEGFGGSSSSSSSSTGNICRTASFEAANGSLTNQGWTALNPGSNQSVQTLTENGITFLRINDQSTTQGLRTEFTSIPDSALADRDWNLEMKARIHNSTENGYVIGMNMLLTSPAGKYASIYIDTDKFGPIGTSINQYNYARTYNADTTNGFHTYAIRYKKNGAGVNDDTFDVLFDGTVVMANVARTEIWDSGVWNQNINGISFGVGSSPGQAQMDVQYVRFQNTDVNNCGSSSSSSSSTSTGGWQCSNGIDDDGDGQTDSNDPGCHTDRNRFNSMSYNPYGNENDNNRSYTCQDGVDNNTNGLVDSQDPICHWDGNANNNPSFTPNANEGFGGSSSSSSSSAGSAQCNNGYDDDGDALVDGNDPGCHTDRNRYNPASYNPNGTENGNDRSRGCQDGVDNNGNGLIDAQDPVCHTDGNPNNPGSFDPNRNEDGGSQGNGCIIIKTRAEDDNGDRIDNNDLPSFTVTLDGGLRSEFTVDGDARFNNLSNGSHNVNMLMFGDWEIDSISPSNGNVTVSGSSCKTVTFNLTDTGDNGHHNNGDDAEVDVRKTASSSEVFPGGTIEYVITIENTGDIDLQNLIVEDRVPSDLTIIDDGDADDRHGNELTWEIDIDEGDTETIRYRVAVPSYMFPGQTIRNDVRVTSDDNDIDIDEDASAFITVIGTMPQTGMTGMVSTASAYLTPIRQAAATSSSSGMGTAAAAATTILTGLGGGIALGRKYLGL